VQTRSSRRASQLLGTLPESLLALGFAPTRYFGSVPGDIQTDIVACGTESSNPVRSSAESLGILLTFHIPSIDLPRYAGRLSDFWSDHPEANCLGSLLTIGHVNSDALGLC
jgi:hypothetical protein